MPAGIRATQFPPSGVEIAWSEPTINPALHLGGRGFKAPTVAGIILSGLQ